MPKSTGLNKSFTTEVTTALFKDLYRFVLKEIFLMVL